MVVPQILEHPVMANSSGSAKIARRYARALAQLCDETGEGAAVTKHLQAVVDVLAATPEAEAFLTNPTIDVAPRRALLTSLLGQVQAGTTATHFALLMLDKGRMDTLSAAVAEFVALEDARSGRADGLVSSAVALDAAEQSRLAASLSRLVGKDVQLVATVDPELIGGLVVRVGNTVWDSSVRNHLNRLRHQLVPA